MSETADVRPSTASSIEPDRRRMVREPLPTVGYGIGTKSCRIDRANQWLRGAAVGLGVFRWSDVAIVNAKPSRG
jgi:hypothetical protein